MMQAAIVVLTNLAFVAAFVKIAHGWFGVRVWRVFNLLTGAVSVGVSKRKVNEK